jgi:hypothetical protein
MQALPNQKMMFKQPGKENPCSQSGNAFFQPDPQSLRRCCLAEKALGNTVETMSRGEIRKDGPGPPGHVANWILGASCVNLVGGLEPWNFMIFPSCWGIMEYHGSRGP